MFSAGHHALHAFRHLSLSPPDADLDAHLALGADIDMTQAHHLGATSERTRFQPRRTSTLSYQNSGSRDPRERSSARSPKNLVVVIPPPDLLLDQRQLGHVLSMGPRHRLSQGLLMPLFPSVFGQLNAIAREYNFPSTLGLCLYLHINENGMTMTPRISDDSWQYLFGHLFDVRQPSGGQQLPIGGYIEFDIDLNKARWFDAWVSGTLRDPEPAFPSVVPSQAPLGAHRRKESQNSSLDGHPVEDRWDDSGSRTLLANSRPETLRHVPRKLSLVDRLESHGIHIPPKPRSHLDHPSSPPRFETHGLSPIPQSAIPPTTKFDLERHVNSWRAATNLYPSSMAEAYKPAPDVGASVGVTTMDEYALERNFQQTVNLDDSHWSVTSAGPCSPVMESPASTRPSSIHLDRRANGSVPVTPTTATSWGPADDDWQSVISSISRLPSPDVGERVVEDIMAPRPSAVWGNSFGWRSAETWIKVYPYSAPQTKPMIRVQLQDFQYPNLVIYPTVDSHLDTDSLPNVSEHAVPSSLSVWGNSFGWRGANTWRKVYPYSTSMIQPVAPISLRRAGGLVSNYPNFCIYPVVYPHYEIYPACSGEEDISQPVSVILDKSITSFYPNLVIYPAVYPHLDIYPPVVEGVKIKVSTQVDVSAHSLGSISTSYPSLNIYPTVYPYFDFYPKALQTAGSMFVRPGQQSNPSVNYPYLVIYPPTYPYFDIYPPHAAITTAEKFQTTNLITHYPNLAIYPAVYPHIDVYPVMARGLDAVEREKGLSNLRRRRIEMWRAKTADQVGLVGPPANNHVWEVDEPLQLDLADYAWSQTSAGPVTSFLELPHTQSISGSVHIDRRVQGSVALTPSTATTWGPQDDDRYSDILSIERLPSPDLGQRVVDDTENAEFPRQPWHLVWPFLGNANQVKTSPSEISASVSKYPHLVIYPPVYPHFDLYSTWENVPALNDRVNASLTSSSVYPVTDIYPAVYPRFNTYPAGLRIKTTSAVVSNVPHELVEVKLPPLYPNLDIHHACYPYNLEHIYPFTNATESIRTPVEAPRAYPWLVIYPPVYPYIIPYPGSSAEICQPLKPELSPVLSPVERRELSVKLPVRYPILELYSAGYPWSLESVYPAISVDDCSAHTISYPSPIPSSVERKQLSVKLSVRYPMLELYSAGYPWSLESIYPAVSVDDFSAHTIPYPSPMLSSVERKQLSVKLPVQYPTLELYSAGYPRSLQSIYPAVSVDDRPEVKSYYPHIVIYPAVYPFVQPYPIDSVHIPGALDEGKYMFVKALLALSEVTSLTYPHFDLYPARPVSAPQPKRRSRKTHMELHASVFRLLEKQPVRHPETYVQLHAEVFQDGKVRTPSGYMQDLDLSSLNTKKQGDISVPEPQHRPLQVLDNATPRPSRSRSGTTTAQSPNKVVFPLGQPSTLLPISSRRVRSPSNSSQSPPAVSESPVLPVSSPPGAYRHMRSTSSRLSQAVQSMMPGAQRRSSSATPGSPPPEDHRERVRDRQRLSLADRRPTVVSPFSHSTNSFEFPARTTQSLQRKDSLVLQRARAYEQSTAALR